MSEMPSLPGAPEEPPTPDRVKSTDAVSVWAFVLSILGVTVVAIPLAVAGVVRTRGRALRGRGFAVAALCLSAVWIVGVAAVVAAGLPPVLSGSTSAIGPQEPLVSTSPQGSPAAPTAPTEPIEADSATPVETAPPAPPPARVKPTRVYWEDVEQGMCIRIPRGSTTDFIVVDCRARHDREVMVNRPLKEPGAWLGDEAMSERVDPVCRRAFSRYVGIAYDDSLLEVDWFTTDKAGWNEGDHTTVCLVYDPREDQLRHPLRGSRE